MNVAPAITLSESEAEATVVGVGELDLYSKQTFQDALKDAAAAGKVVVVDLRGASFIDTAILALLAQAARILMQEKKTLRVVVADGSHPQYVLKIVGFAELMDIVVE